jgi:hypothetical protein
MEDITTEEIIVEEELLEELYFIEAMQEVCK